MHFNLNEHKVSPTKNLTNLNGIASVTLTLGQKTTDNLIYWNTLGNTYSDQYGDNVGRRQRGRC